ncbi:CXXC-20-CXXC protein [Oikeobacillus pervagus]|uniref:CXXC-20-CXXC protein n=1 Tax=Oikeobacillus pervagus TaxID=1325931 RepID=A0AAJ1WGR8_9BACI|nr:TIGR04104 family putative zinc finger protein [Oikeobacillus pervagus]MDQ0215402.1 CXXC-20-CXXC protein [Oikeobacillus pervagus]
MPICQNCQSKWKWKETLLKSFSFSYGWTCPYCQHIQYVSAKSRKKASVFTTLPILLWFPLTIFHVPISVILVIELIAYVMVLLLVPRLYQLRNKEEPLW